MKEIEWKCPHCGNPTGTQVRNHDCFDWQFDDAREMKMLWECNDCDGYYFTYFRLEKITAMKKAVISIRCIIYSIASLSMWIALIPFFVLLIRGYGLVSFLPMIISLPIMWWGLKKRDC